MENEKVLIIHQGTSVWKKRESLRVDCSGEDIRKHSDHYSPLMTKWLLIRHWLNIGTISRFSSINEKFRVNYRCNKLCCCMLHCSGFGMRSSNLSRVACIHRYFHARQQPTPIHNCVSHPVKRLSPAATWLLSLSLAKWSFTPINSVLVVTQAAKVNSQNNTLSQTIDDGCLSAVCGFYCNYSQEQLELFM